MSFCRSLISAVSNNLKTVTAKPLVSSVRQFHASTTVRGFEEFKDQVGKDEALLTGRAWTNADLRRKSFDDMHKLWWLLYKERNLLLSVRNKMRTARKRITDIEEARYVNVKRSMAAIKHTLEERKTIRVMLKRQDEEVALAADLAASRAAQIEAPKN